MTTDKAVHPWISKANKQKAIKHRQQKNGVRCLPPPPPLEPCWFALYVGSICYNTVSLWLSPLHEKGGVFQRIRIQGKCKHFLNAHTICQHLPPKRGFNPKQTALLIGRGGCCQTRTEQRMIQDKVFQALTVWLVHSRGPAFLHIINRYKFQPSSGKIPLIMISVCTIMNNNTSFFRCKEMEIYL